MKKKSPHITVCDKTSPLTDIRDMRFVRRKKKSGKV
jgi:hypothetical protein